MSKKRQCSFSACVRFRTTFDSGADNGNRKGKSSHWARFKRNCTAGAGAAAATANLICSVTGQQALAK